MKDLNNTDLFDPRSTVMDSDLARTVTPSTDADFAFAFNDSNFSDRLLRIEIMGDTPESRPDSEAYTSIADWARHRKRRREDFKKDNKPATSRTREGRQRNMKSVIYRTCTQNNIQSVAKQMSHSRREWKGICRENGLHGCGCYLL